MRILKNKKILIFGMLNKYSISFGIANSLYKNGAELILICKNEKIKNNLKNICKKFSKIILTCDLSKEKNIKNLLSKIFKIWNKIDGIIYSISYTNSNQLNGNYLLNINKKIFNETNDINVYKLIYIIKNCINFFKNNSSILALTYIGSNKVLKNYNIMGPTKSLLESNIKYISYSISEISKNYIKINSISLGPIYTASSSRIKNFKKIISYYKKKTPFNKLINIKNVGNISSFLMSDLSLGINGQNIFIDYGFNIML